MNDIKGPFPAGQSYSFHIHGNLENRARELQGSISSVFEQAHAANLRLASDVQPKLQTVFTATAASLDNTNSIRQTVVDNRGVILTIEAAAEAINTKVNNIGGTVLTIEATGEAINTKVNNIGGTVLTIEATGEAINSKVNDIKGSFPAGQSYSYHIHGNLENRAGELHGSISSVFEQAHAANLRLASDVQPKLQTVLEQASSANVQASAANIRLMRDVQPKLNNVEFVLGSDRAVDPRHGHGAQPLTFYALHGWLNAAAAASEAADARFHANRAATLGGRICEMLNGISLGGFPGCRGL